jgi:hypothetical protein
MFNKEKYYYTCLTKEYAEDAEHILLLFQSALSVKSIYHGYVVNVREWTMSLVPILSAEFHTK